MDRLLNGQELDISKDMHRLVYRRRELGARGRDRALNSAWVDFLLVRIDFAAYHLWMGVSRGAQGHRFRRHCVQIHLAAHWALRGETGALFLPRC